MSNYATDSDVLEIEPRIKDFGVIDFTADHTKTTADIQRLLRIEWWPRVSRQSSTKYFSGAGLEMDNTKLQAAQFKRTAVYHVLAYYILPRLTQHQGEDDRFFQMIAFYKNKFREEFDLVLADGVEYDYDGDGTVDEVEKQTAHYNRLIR